MCHELKVSITLLSSVYNLYTGLNIESYMEHNLITNVLVLFILWYLSTNNLVCRILKKI